MGRRVGRERGGTRGAEKVRERRRLVGGEEGERGRVERTGGWGEADEVIKPGTKSERRSGTQREEDGGAQRRRHPRDKRPRLF